MFDNLLSDNNIVTIYNQLKLQKFILNSELEALSYVDMEHL